MAELDTDEYWVERYLAGETKAFDQLVYRTQNRLYASILRIVGSREEAMDVLQETYLKVFRNIHRFERGCPFYSWVYRIAVNQAISSKRRRRHTGQSISARDESDYLEPPDPESTDTTLDKLLIHERNSIIEKTLQSLPAAQRAVLVMCDFDDLRYDEIASVLGIPIGTVRSRIHRAREELRKRLEPLLNVNEESSIPIISRSNTQENKVGNDETNRN